MAVNLTPQYHEAEAEYKKAQTPADRLACLQKMWALVPKHKASEKLQAELKTKLSAAREEVEHEKKTGKKGGVSYKIPHQGAGQYVLLGGPNAGKSTLLRRLTRATPEVAAYPFTTREPVPGMMAWEDVQVQLIDMPPVTADFLEGYVSSMVRSADAAVLMVDLGDDDGPFAAEAVIDRLAHVKTVLGGAPKEGEDVGIVHVISAEHGTGLEELRTAVYQFLNVIRVYTKKPGKPPDMTSPFTVPEGSTLLELATHVHRDFEEKLKSARAWGAGVFDGQNVPRDHVLHDRDVVELHG